MEDQYIEWKQIWKEEYLKWICGYANAQGGSIYIGLNDEGEVVGVDHGDDLLDKLPNKILDALGIVCDINAIEKNERLIIEIKVSPQPFPVHYHGEYFYRSGATKQTLRGQALNQFLMKKMHITWENSIIPNVEIEQFRNDSFDSFRKKALLSKRMESEDMMTSNEDLMEKLELIEDGDCKRAGILLFHHNPEKWIPGAYVKIGYFETDADIHYQDEVHGSLLLQAEQVTELIYLKYLKAKITYQGIQRVEAYPFPKEAVREAVLNAIVHKDYQSGIPIQISVYANRLYIANDGYLPKGWSLEELMMKHRSKPYNPLLANAFYRAGLIESWGRGIEKMKQSCISAGIPLPKYHIKPGDIMVEFQGQQEDEKEAVIPSQHLNSTQQKIISMILVDPCMTQKEMATQIGLSSEAIKKNIRILKEKGILIAHGPRRTQIWTISDSYPIE